MAVCTTHWVTMVTLFVESDRLVFGYPFPAFRYGRSSGTWLVEGVPLLLGFLLATILSIPVFALVTSMLRGRLVMAMGIAAAIVTAALHVNPLLLVVLNKHKIRWQWQAPRPVVCQEVWIGPPQVSLLTPDPENPCVEPRR